MLNLLKGAAKSSDSMQRTTRRNRVAAAGLAGGRARGRLLDHSCPVAMDGSGNRPRIHRLFAPDGNHGRPGAVFPGVVANVEPGSVEGTLVRAWRGHSHRRRDATACPQNGRRPAAFLRPAARADGLGTGAAGTAEDLRRAPHGRLVCAARADRWRLPVGPHRGSKRRLSVCAALPLEPNGRGGLLGGTRPPGKDR